MALLRAARWHNLRDYLAAIPRDARASLARVLRDRAALAAMILLLLPWLALVFIRDNADWVEALGGIALVVGLFWWMSRSGAAPAPSVKHPRVEFLLIVAMIALWVEYRAATCGKFLPFIPADFNCFNNWGFEVAPKLAIHVFVPVLVLLIAGYRLGALGLGWSGRAGWVGLLPLVAYIAARFVLHPRDPLQFLVTHQEQFLFHLFGAGLPEEVLFRALLLTRLEAWWKNSAWVLFGAALVFGLAHLPINFLVFTNRDPRETWITLLTFQMGFGAAFCFAYQRIRNVYPIAVLHMMVNVV
jgi:membrane protease YdiL (CAAX protease family)